MEHNSTSNLEDNIDAMFSIEIRNKTDIFKVRVGNDTYYSDIIDCFTDKELIGILSDKGIQANNASRDKLVSLAKKAIRDLYISPEEVTRNNNYMIWTLIGLLILASQLIVLVITLIRVGPVIA